MSDGNARLVIVLEAQAAKLQRDLVAVSRQIDRFAAQTDRRFSSMQKSADARFGAIGRAIGGALSVAAAQRFLDANTRIENGLKTAGLAGEELARVYEALFSAAQRNAAPVEALTQLYSRASLAQKELGVTSEELLTFTENVAVALRVSGRSAAESSGALLQLSQALGGGTVRAEEFNSIMEGALPVAQAAAAGLEEAGGSVAKLRKLVIEGKVSSEAFFRAFEAGAGTLRGKVADAAFTLAQGLTTVENAAIKTAGQFDDATGLSVALGGALNDLASFVGDVGNAFAENAAPIGGFFKALGDGLAGLERWKTDFRAALGLSGPGGLDDFLDGTNLLKGQIGFASQQKFDPAGEGANFGDLAAFRAPATGTVSLSQFKPPVGTGSEALDGYERARNAIIDQTDALVAQAAAQAALNPLVNDYGAATDRARIELDLMRAAIDARVPIDDKLIAQIRDLADGYAIASVEAQKLAESQDRIRETAGQWRDLSRDALSGLISDLLEAKSAGEALGAVFTKIGNQLLDMGLTSPVGQVFTLEFAA